MFLEQYFRGKPKPLLFAMAVAGVAVIAYFDLITGYQVSFFLFYFGPILFSVWFLGHGSTAFLVLLSTAAWWWADWAAGHQYTSAWIPLWNTGTRLVFFIFSAVGGTAIKERRDSLDSMLANLKRMRELERDIVATSEREQQRIGADLHDGLCQYLAGITCITSSLSEDLASDYPPLAAPAAEVHELLKEAIAQAREIARGIAPVHMDEVGLASALDELAASTRRFHDIDCTFELDGDASVSSSQISANLYRIAQEAVANAVRHGHATRVQLLLATNRDTATLSILDNGAGFPDGVPPAAGMGLRSMHYRAGVLGGAIEIGPGPQGGACVRCQAPLDQPTGTTATAHAS